jgi:hypothetical protein
MLVLGGCKVVPGVDERSSAPKASDESSVGRVTFVQLTSPHLFDAGEGRHGKGIEEEALDNRAALHWVVLETNRLVLTEGRSIDFVVITGGFGLSNVTLPEQHAAPVRPCECPKRRSGQEGPIAAVSLAEAATDVARTLSPLLVKRVLVVPGDNDLCDGHPDDLHRWAHFVHALRGALHQHERPGRTPPEIVDLTYSLERLYGTHADIRALFAETGPPGKITPLQVNGIDLVGLNSAYFKPQKSRAAQHASHAASVDEMVRIRERIVAGGSYLIFTHAADMPDPQSALAAQTGAPPNPTPWDVPKDARTIWNDQILKRSEVIGVFAGHFLTATRETYPSNFSTVKPPPSLTTATKTWLAPPLAIKDQFRLPPDRTARGLLLVSATTSGAVRVAGPLWFALDQKAAIDGDDKLIKARAEGLAGNWEEAAKGYADALASTDPRVRASAVAGYEHARAKTRTWWWQVGGVVPLLRWSIIHPPRALAFAAFLLLVLPVTIWILRKLGLFGLIRWAIKATFMPPYQGRARLNATTELNKGAPVDVFWAQMVIAGAEIRKSLRREQAHWMAGQVALLTPSAGTMNPLIEAIPNVQGVNVSALMKFLIQLGQAFRWNVDSRLAMFAASGVPAPAPGGGPAALPDRGQFAAHVSLQWAWMTRSSWHRVITYESRPSEELAELARHMAGLVMGEGFV